MPGRHEAGQGSVPNESRFHAYATADTHPAAPRAHEEIPSLPSGTMLSQRYRISGHLGTGGWACVYAAEDLTLRRSVAIKILHPWLAQSPTTTQRFLREARTLAAHDSPHVVPIYDAARDGKLLFLVMKLFRSPSLGVVLQQDGPLSPMRLVHVALDALAGLDALHAMGIVHRDIKPSNIMVTAEGRAVLLDLGVALDSNSPGVTTGNMIMGTPSFMSPEQAMGRAPDGRSDLYALGATLYDCLAGRPPFIGASQVEICVRQVSEQPPTLRRFVPDIHPDLEEIILKALAKDPDRRFHSATEMAERLRQIVEYLPLTPYRSDWIIQMQARSSGQRPPPPQFTDVSALLTSNIDAYATTTQTIDPSPHSGMATPPPVVERECPEVSPKPIRTKTRLLMWAMSLPCLFLAPHDSHILTHMTTSPIELPSGVSSQPPVADKLHTPILPPPTPLANKLTTLEKPVISPASRSPEAANPQVHFKGPSAPATPRARTTSNETDRLIVEWEQVRRDQPSPTAFKVLGDLYHQVGNRDAAIASYRRFLTLEPVGPQADQVRQKLEQMREGASLRNGPGENQ